MAHKPHLTGEKAAKAELTAAGVNLDWDNLDWNKVFAIIQSIIALFAARKPVMGAGHEHDTEMLKAHFDAIAAVAACGSQCCEA